MRNIAITTSALLAICGLQPTTVFAQTDDSILSDAHITKQDYVEAEVIYVKPKSRTITVKGEKRGETRQFSVPENVRISVNGQQARLRDIRRGDSVLVTFAKRSQKIIVNQIRMPDSAVTLAERRANPIVAQATPAVLPSTASFLPAVLLFGLVSLGGAATIRRLRA